MKSLDTEREAGDRRPELFVGIIGPVGTDLALVVECLLEELRRVSYNPIEIRLSKLIAACPAYSSLDGLVSAPEDERINSYMDAGDSLRASLKHGDAVVRLAIAKIQEIRVDAGHGETFLPRTVYIFNSLKHPAEVDTLRQLYRDQFLAISIYSPRAARSKVLTERIAKSRSDAEVSKFIAAADALIDRDEEEIDTPLGQSVRETFSKADYFIKMGGKSLVSQQLQRFVNLVFGDPFITPTKAEYGMFHAKAAALRSADLSRQVGAVIATAEAEIIASGCNEVPHQGGGAAWESAPTEEPAASDYRDFKIGRDPSVLMKQRMVREVIDAFKESGWLAESVAATPTNTLVDQAIFDGRKSVLRNRRITSIIEFGRIVHAEMSALMDAAKRGVSTKNATLICTTFPCHMCARHIVAAGISRVVYIEPYPKSMAKDLYEQTIQVDGDHADEDAVIFDPFIGMAPRRYIDFFEMPKRKDERGYKLPWSPANATPRLAEAFWTYRDAELSFVEFLKDNAHLLGFIESAD